MSPLALLINVYHATSLKRIYEKCYKHIANPTMTITSCMTYLKTSYTIQFYCSKFQNAIEFDPNSTFEKRCFPFHCLNSNMFSHNTSK